MPISTDALKGYILEEVLARLLRKSGYSLLVDEQQDPEELRNRHNGLAVIGRGAKHQVDVLGQLDWIPAFTFPIRLFLEAKFRSQPIGLGDVRNAVGILADLRENHTSAMGMRQRYNYNYALFSTSGFTEGAANMALAHHVSLVDLNIPGFQPLLNAISDAAKKIFDNGALGSDPNPLLRLRNRLRDVLNTKPYLAGPSIADDQSEMTDALREALDTIRDSADEFSDLFLGVPNGPFLLVLKAESPNAFLEFARRNPRHSVRIRWEQDADHGQTWWIEPSQDETAYRLSFRIPLLLVDWIASQKNGPRQGALDAKTKFLSRITIYRVEDGKDSLFRLEFQRPNHRLPL